MNFILVLSFYFQVEYHELETFNGDSSSISVVQPQFSMENLQVVKRMTTT